MRQYTGLAETAARLEESLGHLRQASEWMLDALRREPDAALCGATPYLELFALAAGATHVAAGAMSPADTGGAHVETARFLAANLLPATSGLLAGIVSGADALRGADAALQAG